MPRRARNAPATEERIRDLLDRARVREAQLKLDLVKGGQAAVVHLGDAAKQMREVIGTSKDARARVNAARWLLDASEIGATVISGARSAPAQPAAQIVQVAPVAVFAAPASGAIEIAEYNRALAEYDALLDGPPPAADAGADGHEGNGHGGNGNGHQPETPV